VPLNAYYRFVTHWRVEGSPAEVYRVIDEPTDFPRWWPAVWLEADAIEKGDERGIGRTIRFVSRGWLPYVLRWTARTIEADPPHRLALSASGDFEGEGRWTLTADGPYVDVEYVWTIHANKPLLRYLSFLLRPAFAANHRWAMARGEESLRRELSRRRSSPD
jgi:hypothetical protein